MHRGATCELPPGNPATGRRARCIAAGWILAWMGVFRSISGGVPTQHSFRVGRDPGAIGRGDRADHIYGLPAQPARGSTLCLSRGKPVAYRELRRELRFKRMPLEANVEPELEGKVMPAFICEVRTQPPLQCT